MIFRELNIKKQCDDMRIGLWGCPHFLFLVMGMFIIVAMVGTNVLARRYADPEVSALAVITVTALLFVISHVVIRSFERVAESIRARADFISIISHQLRNPLSSIRWQLEVLMRDQTFNKQIQSYLESINEYNNRMAKLVNDLLTVNRIDNNRLVLAPATFSLTGLTQKILADNTLFANASNITFAMKTKGRMPMVFADEHHIRWAVENLVSNAIRYSNPRTTITITIEKKVSGALLWRITNHGPPISPSDGRHIFKKFFRPASTMRRRADGSGLGLFIAKAVVEASGGDIGFSSENGGITQFWFTLPRAKKPPKTSTQSS